MPASARWTDRHTGKRQVIAFDITLRNLSRLTDTLARVKDHPDLGERTRDALSARLQTALRESAIQGRQIQQRKQELRDNREALAVRYDYRNIIGNCRGAYRLQWQVLAGDGHITRGEVPFQVK
jgi:hypothetical protein